MWRRPLAVALVALPLLGGCGGADHSTTASSTSLTLSAKVAYIHEADALCGHLASDIRSLPAPGTLEATAVYLQERIVLATGARDALGALEPPVDAETVHRALLDELEQSIAKSGEALDAAKKDNADALAPLLDEAQRLAHAADAIADAFGLHECGSA